MITYNMSLHILCIINSYSLNVLRAMKVFSSSICWYLRLFNPHIHPEPCKQYICNSYRDSRTKYISCSYTIQPEILPGKNSSILPLALIGENFIRELFLQHSGYGDLYHILSLKNDYNTRIARLGEIFIPRKFLAIIWYIILIYSYLP